MQYSTVGCRRTARLEFPDFIRTCQARNLKIRTVWIIVCEMCADLALCTSLKRAALIANKNVNQLELRKLSTVPGYDAGPHVLQHPTVLYAYLKIRVSFEGLLPVRPANRHEYPSCHIRRNLSL